MTALPTLIASERPVITLPRLRLDRSAKERGILMAACWPACTMWRRRRPVHGRAYREWRSTGAYWAATHRLSAELDRPQWRNHTIVAHGLKGTHLPTLKKKKKNISTKFKYVIDSLNTIWYFLAKLWLVHVLKYTLKCSQLISSSDNKKILLTTRIVRLDSGLYATKYYYHTPLLKFSSTNVVISP